MPIDTSILGSYQPPKQENLFNTLAQFEAIRSAQQQGQMNAMQIQKAQREAEQEKQWNALLTNPDVIDQATGQIKPTAFAEVGRQGAGQLAPKLFELSTKQQTERRQSEKALIEQQQAKLKLVGDQILQNRDALATITTPEGAKAWEAAMWGNPVLTDFFASQGITREQSRKELEEALAAPDGGGLNRWRAQQLEGAKTVSERLRDEAVFGEVTREARDILAQMKGRQDPKLTGAATSLEIGPNGKPMVGAPGVMATTANQILQHQISAELAMEKGNAKLAETFMGLAQKLTQSVPQEYREYLLAKADEGFRQYQLRSREASATKIDLGKELTPYQKKLDEKAADDVLEWKQGGGTTMVGNIRKLRGVVAQLERGEKLSGPVTGITPDFILAFSESGRKAIDARQKVEQVVQQDLRRILGAQFTEKEGKDFLSRVFDPKLTPRQLAARVRDLLTQMEQAAIQKQSMAEYLDENGTLRGYKGPQPTLRAIEGALFGEKDAGAASAGKAPKGVPQDVWEAMPPEDRKLWSK
jgi:hypothetical protein